MQTHALVPAPQTHLLSTVTNKSSLHKSTRANTTKTNLPLTAGLLLFHVSCYFPRVSSARALLQSCKAIISSFPPWESLESLFVFAAFFLFHLREEENQTETYVMEERTGTKVCFVFLFFYTYIP